MEQIKLKNKKKLCVRLAENQLEIEKALSLRYNVFNIEMQEGLSESHQTGKDRDAYDNVCDHLIVLDEANDQVVGTYRILTKSKAVKNFGFYSENEFELQNIYKVPGEIAELGRSCVHPSYRDGSVISLLWAGIGKYIQDKQIEYLIGCASLHTTESLIASRAYAFFKGKNCLADKRFEVNPKKEFLLQNFSENLDFDSINELTRFIPPLIKGYVRIGTKVCGYPAIDKEFGTIDFFLLFNRTEITGKYKKHYYRD